MTSRDVRTEKTHLIDTTKGDLSVLILTVVDSWSQTTLDTGAKLVRVYMTEKGTQRCVPTYLFRQLRHAIRFGFSILTHFCHPGVLHTLRFRRGGRRASKENELVPLSFVCIIRLMNQAWKGVTINNADTEQLAAKPTRWYSVKLYQYILSRFGWIDNESSGADDVAVGCLANEIGLVLILFFLLQFMVALVAASRFIPTSNDVHDLFDRVCVLMDIDPNVVELSLFNDDNSSFLPSALGLYQQDENGRFHVWLEASTLDDPLSAVAVMAHELGHVHLLGHRRLDAEVDDDHEPVTDLLTVFMGFGVVCANASLHETSWSSGTMTSWGLAQQGYLSMQSYGYALALNSAFRREVSRPEWRRHLRADLKSYFDSSRRFFEDHGSPDLLTLRTTRARPKLQISPISDSDLSEIPDGSCTFCGEPTTPPNDVCDACVQSIEDGQFERGQELKVIEANDRWARVSFWWSMLAVFLFAILFLAFAKLR